MSTTSKELFDQLVTQVISPGLVANGFRSPAALVWTRETSEIWHVVAVTGGPDTNALFWGLYEPTAAYVVYGVSRSEPGPAECIVQGTPATIRIPPAPYSLSLDELEPGEMPLISDAVRRDVAVMVDHTAAFQTRRSIREHLMAVGGEEDWDRDFIVPTGLGWKLVISAALALADSDPLATCLVDEARAWMAEHGWSDDPKLARLQRLASSADERDKLLDAEVKKLASAAGGVLYWKFEVERRDALGREREQFGPAWMIGADGEQEDINEGRWIARSEAARIAVARDLRFDDQA